MKKSKFEREEFNDFVWFGKSIHDYNAKELKDKILAEFISNPGKYGYGILLGKQQNGYYVVCINIDVDNDCKDKAKNKLEEVLIKHHIIYHLETTITGGYHIFVILDKVTETLKKTTKIVFNKKCIKYENGKPLPGKIELLGANRRYPIAVYNGIINDEKPFFVYPLIVNQAEDFEKVIIEFRDIFIIE
jgi:hypothetical protein